MFRLFVSLCFVALGTAIQARDNEELPLDKGKRRIAPLFACITKPLVPSVVRVLCDDKESILGTIVSEDGYILTKGSELRGEITVRFPATEKAIVAKKIGYDKASDLALLKVEKKGLTPVKFLDNDPAEVGNWVAIVGLEDKPISVGVVSVKARSLYGDQKMIMNVNGAYMGIGMDDNDSDGVVVTEVKEGSPAAKALVKKGDTITEIDGKPIKDRIELSEIMSERKAGDVVTLTIIRGEKGLALKVRLASWLDSIPEKQRDKQNSMGGALSGRRTGFPKIIQHDSILDPKNCGGPLVDIDGRFLGINIARAGRVETWTIPSKTIKPILAELLAGKNEEEKP